MIGRAWKGAEAYHFYLLAQRQLYAGYVDAAMITGFLSNFFWFEIDCLLLALNLLEYEEFISVEKVHSLIALASASNKAFEVCSQSFMKLETSSDISIEDRKLYKELAMKIFSKFVLNLSKTSNNLYK